jgi:hypothetical protein
LRILGALRLCFTQRSPRGGGAKENAILLRHCFFSFGIYFLLGSCDLVFGASQTSNFFVFFLFF